MIAIREVSSDHPDFLALQTDPVWEYQRCLVAYDGDKPCGCVCFHRDEEMHGTPADTGVVGHYEAADAEAGRALLREAIGLLQRLGVKSILGPINGNIWSRFRLARNRDDTAPFFLEPTNPECYHHHFIDAGFRPDTEYHSRIIEDLQSTRNVVPALAEGLQLRNFDPSKPEVEMPKLFELSIRAFAKSLYHRPISFEAFQAMHLPLLPQLDPELFLIVEAEDGSPAAFLLAYPDYFRPESGRVIAKTLGVLPVWRRNKLGSYLVARIQHVARAKGYQSLIHALMESCGASNTISQSVPDKNERIFRSYLLYRWEEDHASQT